MKWIGVDVRAQQDARGGFGFTGDQTGSALGGFSARHAGNGVDRVRQRRQGLARHGLRRVLQRRLPRQRRPDAESWRPLGIRVAIHGSAGPAREPRHQRTGFAVGRRSASGRVSASLLRPDRSGVQPRLGVSWRPVPGSSLVIRGGYGLYRNTEVYQPLALLLAQQPPFSTTFSVQTRRETPLTLANGFIAGARAPRRTPSRSIRTSASASRTTGRCRCSARCRVDLTVLVQYLGTRGTHLTQASLPNTNPAGAIDPVSVVPVGIHLPHVGRHLAPARGAADAAPPSAQRTDGGGASTPSRARPTTRRRSSGAVSPSSLADRAGLARPRRRARPVVVRSAAPDDRRVPVHDRRRRHRRHACRWLWGALYKDWTITSQLSAGSGLPSTPVYFAPVPGTGVVGVRPR